MERTKWKLVKLVEVTIKEVNTLQEATSLAKRWGMEVGEYKIIEAKSQ